MVTAAQIANARLRGMLGRWVPVIDVRLQAAVAEFLNVQLVPIRAGHFRAFLPQEERADDSVARREANARIEASVVVPFRGVHFSAGHGHSRRGKADGRSKDTDERSPRSHAGTINVGVRLSKRPRGKITRNANHGFDEHRNRGEYSQVPDES